MKPLFRIKLVADAVPSRALLPIVDVLRARGFSALQATSEPDAPADALLVIGMAAGVAISPQALGWIARACQLSMAVYLLHAPLPQQAEVLQAFGAVVLGGHLDALPSPTHGDLPAMIRAALPRDSVGRYDVMPLFANAALRAAILARLATPYWGRVGVVAAPEATGWMLGMGLAQALGVGFVGLRQAGHLPYPVHTLHAVPYTDYSSKLKCLQAKPGTIEKGSKVLIADDWVETGATASAAITLVEAMGGNVIGIASIGIDPRHMPQAWRENGFVTFIGDNI